MEETGSKLRRQEEGEREKNRGGEMGQGRRREKEEKNEKRKRGVVKRGQEDGTV